MASSEAEESSRSLTRCERDSCCRPVWLAVAKCLIIDEKRTVQQALRSPPSADHGSPLGSQLRYVDSMLITGEDADWQAAQLRWPTPSSSGRSRLRSVRVGGKAQCSIQQPWIPPDDARVHAQGLRSGTGSGERGHLCKRLRRTFQGISGSRPRAGSPRKHAPPGGLHVPAPGRVAWQSTPGRSGRRAGRGAVCGCRLYRPVGLLSRPCPRPRAGTALRGRCAVKPGSAAVMAASPARVS
jgi:hypothetical protein